MTLLGINDAAYPGYRALIQSLQSSYPSWNFRLYYTGLDWNEVIVSECQGHNGSPKSLFQYGSSYRGDWYCPVCGTKKYDNGTWYCASEAAVAYVMDPRNSINATDIFQFHDLSYTSTFDYGPGVRAMVTGTFLNNEELILAIIEAGTTKNINPLFITARILQEQGPTGSVLSSGNGYGDPKQYVGYYNYFNIGATGNTTEAIILNGLATAYARGWNTPKASIIGGITTLADNYVSKGQNTCYFQKYNVVNKNNLYGNQYMQNILAAQSEGTKIRNAYNAISALGGNHTFIIPVYENMPAQASPRPNASADYVAKEFDKATLNASELAIRATPNGRVLGYAYLGANITVLARATDKINGLYWDKVMASNYYGYMARGTADGSKTYIATHTYGKDTINGAANSPNNNFKEGNIDGTNTLVMEPKTTLNDIRNKGYVISSATKDGVDVSGAGTLGTGTVIVTDKGEFVVVKLGDIRGTGVIEARDAARVLSYTVGEYSIIDPYLLKAADIDGNGAIEARDAARILSSTVGQYILSI